MKKKKIILIIFLINFLILFQSQNFIKSGIIILDQQDSGVIRNPDPDNLRLNNMVDKLGNNFSSLVSCQKQESLTNLNTSSSFNITAESDWNMTSTLNFTDIYSPLFQKIYQPRMTTMGLYVSQYEYASAFAISEDTTLTTVSFYVRIFWNQGLAIFLYKSKMLFGIILAPNLPPHYLTCIFPFRHNQESG